MWLPKKSKVHRISPALPAAQKTLLEAFCNCDGRQFDNRQKKAILQNPRKPPEVGDSVLYISSLGNEGSLFSTSTCVFLLQVSKYARRITL